MRERVLGFLIWLAYRLLSWSWRVTISEPDSLREAMRERRPFVLAHWHGDEMALLHLVGRYRVATLSSRSRDGRIMAIVLHRLGAITCAGSSSRGGAAAFKALIRLMREGRNASFAVDGPRGPIYKVKPGVLEMSRALGCPIYYPTIRCDRAFRLHRAWNEGYVPKPFARVCVQLLGPMPPVPRDRDPRDPALLGELESRMLEARARGHATMPGAAPAGG